MKAKTIYLILGVAVAGGIGLRAYRKYLAKPVAAKPNLPQNPVKPGIETQKTLPSIPQPVLKTMPVATGRRPDVGDDFMGDRPVTSSGITFANQREQTDYYQKKYGGGRSVAGLR